MELYTTLQVVESSSLKVVPIRSHDNCRMQLYKELNNVG